MIRSYRCAGISLIASSMALIFAGLVLAALLSSHTLLRSAALRSIIIQVDHYQSAFHAFDAKYGNVPGDYPIAVAQWGTITADGNGDGEVLGWEEEIHAWQHLTLSGILPETSAVLKEDTQAVALGVNMPKTRFADTSFRFTSRTHPLYGIRSGNTLELGAMDKSAISDVLGRGALTGYDALTVDGKIDDGIANSGQVFAMEGRGGTQCVTNAGHKGVISYITGSDAADCRMVFWMN